MIGMRGRGRSENLKKSGPTFREFQWLLTFASRCSDPSLPRNEKRIGFAGRSTKGLELGENYVAGGRKTHRMQAVGDSCLTRRRPLLGKGFTRRVSIKGSREYPANTNLSKGGSVWVSEGTPVALKPSSRNLSLGKHSSLLTRIGQLHSPGGGLSRGPCRLWGHRFNFVHHGESHVGSLAQQLHRTEYIQEPEALAPVHAQSTYALRLQILAPLSYNSFRP